MVREHFPHGGRRFLAWPFLLFILLGAMYGYSPASAQGRGLLEVRAADTLPEGLISEVKAISGVSKTDAYLYVRTTPHDVIGLGPGAVLRIPSREEWVAIEVRAGRGFRARDRNAAIVGMAVFREDYKGKTGGIGPMAGMLHPFQVGSSFRIKGYARRLRVVGTFTSKQGGVASKLFLPLATAQKIFKKEGRISHLLLTLKEGASVEEVKKALKEKVGADATVLIR